MFSLVITLISIALVAALALATLYYGGAIFNEGAERALVSRIEAQAQQLMGALDLYKADTGAYPATLDLLVSSNYLKSLPTALDSTQNTLSSAYAATSTWTLAGPYAPVTVLTPVSEATCKAFNKVKYGQAGVLKALRMQLGQCFGTDVNNLMIVTAKSTADLVAVAADPAAAIQLGTVLPDAIPSAGSTDASSAGWLVPPASPTSASYLDSNGNVLSNVGFPDTAVGATSAPVLVTIKNNGATDLTFTATGATVGAPFAIGGNSCAATTLAVAATCTVAITFTPTAIQGYSGASYALVLQAANATLPNLQLMGTGVAGGPPVASMTLDPDPSHYLVDFAWASTYTAPNGCVIVPAVLPAGSDWIEIMAANPWQLAQFPILTSPAGTVLTLESYIVTFQGAAPMAVDVSVVDTCIGNQCGPWTDTYPAVSMASLVTTSALFTSRYRIDGGAVQEASHSYMLGTVTAPTLVIQENGLPCI